jgi:hypothetical protein
MTKLREQFLTTLFWMPPLVVLFLFEFFLGHRHDYSGHYLAGYGATFIAAMLGLRVAWGTSFRRWIPYFIVPFCLLCILGGVVTEATLFRLAKFDEVDFFNQSLGAVLAMLVVQIFVDTSQTTFDITNFNSEAMARWCDGGIVLGVIYLGIGGFLAFA